MYQTCPLCDGRGFVSKALDSSSGANEWNTCTVCSGQKVIHTNSGHPPVELKITWQPATGDIPTSPLPNPNQQDTAARDKLGYLSKERK